MIGPSFAALQGNRTLTTRQTRNNPFSRLIVPALSLVLLAYFSYHAWSGRYGIESMRQMREEAVHLEFELAATRLKRRAIEERVALLRDGTIERDMLDEQARGALNLLQSDELAILKMPDGRLSGTN